MLVERGSSGNCQACPVGARAVLTRVANSAAEPHIYSYILLGLLHCALLLQSAELEHSSFETILVACIMK